MDNVHHDSELAILEETAERTQAVLERASSGRCERHAAFYEFASALYRYGTGNMYRLRDGTSLVLKEQGTVTINRKKEHALRAWLKEHGLDDTKRWKRIIHLARESWCAFSDCRSPEFPREFFHLREGLRVDLIPSPALRVD